MKPVVPANVPASPKTLVTSCAKAALDSAAASNNELILVQCMMLNMLTHRANAVHREDATWARSRCGERYPSCMRDLMRRHSAFFLAPLAFVAVLALLAPAAALAAAPPADGTVPSADGVPIHYHVEGAANERPALVFVHC